MINNILILGGGSAGWMAATALQATLGKHGFNITLVESPIIGTIGVGEGSTPHLHQFFNLIKVPESHWMPACNATYKNGISFINWTSHLTENRYFHPFPSVIDRQTAMPFLTSVMQKHAGKNVPTNPDHFFLARELSDKGLGPKTAQGKPTIPINYAYHFDSIKLGLFLSELGKQRGVQHIQGQYVSANLDTQNNIESIVLDDGRTLSADFFIDASGFTSHLLQKALTTPFESFEHNLFNDSAIALPSVKENPILAETKATALSSGWAWHIPLTTRTGNGYVFSSRFIDFDKAENELRAHLHKQDIHVPDDAKARHIKMKVGQVSQAWKQNVMAIGLAQGFIEPLEATALHLVFDSIQLFLKQFNHGDYTETNIKQFNQAVNSRYQGIRDYIVCHYKVNSKHLDISDNGYWKACFENDHLSDNLKAVLARWEKGQDITPVIIERKMDMYYPVMSWYCLLSGYGHFGHVKNLSESDLVEPPEFRRMRQFIEKMTGNFEAHATLLS